MDKQFFLDRLSERELSLRGLAKEMNMSHTQLSLTFGGSRRLQLDEAVSLGNRLGMSLQEVAARAGAVPMDVLSRRVSVTGALNGQGLVDPTPEGIIERVTGPTDLPPGALAIQARTAGTPLSWFDGSVWFYRDVPGSDYFDQLCVVTTADGRIALARVTRGYQAGCVNLCGPFAEVNVVITAAFPVIGMKNSE